LVQCNIVRQIMIDVIELESAQPADDRQIGGWRVVAAAWAVLLVLLLLLAGVSAVACPRAETHPHRHLAAAVIPQHDPCVGPGLPSAQDVDGCKTIPVAKIWAGAGTYW
jgi:hypothetical protein